MTFFTKNLIGSILFGALLVSPAFASAEGRPGGEERHERRSAAASVSVDSVIPSIIPAGGEDMDEEDDAIAVPPSHLGKDKQEAMGGEHEAMDEEGDDSSRFDHEDDHAATSTSVGSGCYVQNCTATTTPPIVEHAPVISSVVATRGTSTTTIAWTTDVPATSSVFYGTTTPFDVNASSTLSTTSPLLTTSHSFTLTGLTASTTYLFIVKSANSIGSAISSLYSFITNLL